MINKPVLDAIAAVLKEERRLTDTAVATLRKESVEEMDIFQQQILVDIEAHRQAMDAAVKQLNDYVAKICADLASDDNVIRATVEQHAKDVTEMILKIDGASLGLEANANEVRTLLDDMQKEIMKRISDLPAGEKGERGEIGEKGLDGRDGKDGANGLDGKDGADGPAGQDGERGIEGAAGRDGSNGRDGSDGRDGFDGQAGAEGIDRDLVAPFYPEPHDSLEKNSVAYSRGGLYQAIRKTIGCPVTDPNSYRLVLNGLAEITSEQDDTNRVTLIKAISSDGSSIIVKVPYGVDGKNGDKGEPGIEGGRGRKGIKGDTGVGVEDILMQSDNLIITLTNGVSRAFPIPKAQVPTVEKMQGVHDTAPIAPPVDYLWVSPNGKAQIWTGTKWIKLT